MGVEAAEKLSPPSRLPGRRRQAAAVCYRIRKRGIEFLLVQTRGGRWIFPKGGVEPGLTPAQSAALEAFEEAGVHGRMEAIPFARYFRRRLDTAARKKGTPPAAARPAQAEFAVTAHLCEVSRLEPPQESNRNPTWFAAEKAKQRLLQDRAPELGTELAGVIDRALSRIQRLHDARNAPDRIHRDGLQEVRLEAFEDRRLPDDLKAALIGIGRHGFLGQRRDARSTAAIKVAVETHLRSLRQIGAKVGTNNEIRRPVLRLGSGTGSHAETVDNLTAIDNGRRPNLSKPGNLPSSKREVR
jgi:8-oxo-dGTP pyrophosphatase MutT (NUDIX family)